MVLYLTACATTSDPHEGGFMGGVQGLSSGEYDRRIDERQARLDRMKKEQAQLDNESNSLAQDKSSLEKKIQQEKYHITELKKKNQLLKKKIARLNSNNEVDKNDLNKLNKQAAKLTKNINKTNNSLDALEGDMSGTASVDRQRAQLEAQRKELEKEYQLLFDMTLDLGQ